MGRLRSAVGAIALALGAIAPIGVAPSPAHAATCTAQQVDVVVDFGPLGASTGQACAPAAGNAASAFGAVGYLLRYAQQVPGAVCQINGQPADTPCQQMPPANAYWGLFWADGSTSRWTYSTFGVQSLTVPAGGAVAFAWQDSATPRYPSIAPPVTRPKTAPKPSPSHHARRTRAARPSATAATTSAAASATSQTLPPSESPVPTGTPTSPNVAASTSTVVPTDASTAADAQPAIGSTSHDSGGGLPAWVPVGLVGVLVLAAGVIMAVRGRRTP